MVVMMPNRCGREFVRSESLAWGHLLPAAAGTTRFSSALFRPRRRSRRSLCPDFLPPGQERAVVFSEIRLCAGFCGHAPRRSLRSPFAGPVCASGPGQGDAGQWRGKPHRAPWRAALTASWIAIRTPCLVLAVAIRFANSSLWGPRRTLPS